MRAAVFTNGGGVKSSKSVAKGNKSQKKVKRICTVVGSTGGFAGCLCVSLFANMLHSLAAVFLKISLISFQPVTFDAKADIDVAYKIKLQIENERKKIDALLFKRTTKSN